MIKHILDEYLDTLKENFKNVPNKYEAHLKSHPVLHRMSQDDEVVHEMFRRAMKKSDFINKFNCTPDISLVVMDEPEVFLFASFFGPNKEKKTDVSYSTMHHHDDYLLSTLNAKGAGYKSLIFKQGYEIDKEKMKATVALDKYVTHKENNIEFIDCHTAHTIFYPKETTMTYALWSTHYPASQTTKWKSHPLIQSNKQRIKKVLNTFKVNPKSLKVAQYREDYFYPNNGELVFLPGQVLPNGGDHYIQNFFNLATNFLNFEDFKFLKELYSSIKKSDPKNEKITWIEKVVEREKIERNYSGYEMYTPKRNVSIDEYQKIYHLTE